MQKTLDDWLNARPGKAKELAAALNTSESHLSQVRSGTRTMRTPWMLTVEKFTNGHVSVVQMVKEVTEHERQRKLAGELK